MREMRGLTKGEEALCREIFKDTIPYGKVLIKQRRTDTPWAATSILGHITFANSSYREDFIGPDVRRPIPASQDPRYKYNDAHYFLHEMTHVWHHYVGFHVFFKKLAAVSGYDYVFDDKKDDLIDYNIEQQGDIIADYFAYTLWGKELPALTKGRIKEYEKVLKNFKADPSYPSGLTRLRKARAERRAA